VVLEAKWRDRLANHADALDAAIASEVKRDAHSRSVSFARTFE
jgi:hypothetical protein